MELKCRFFWKCFCSFVSLSLPMLRHAHSSPKICNLSNLTASLNNTMYKNSTVVYNETGGCWSKCLGRHLIWGAAPEFVWRKWRKLRYSSVRITVFWYLMECFLVFYIEFNARSSLFRRAYLPERRNSHILN